MWEDRGGDPLSCSHSLTLTEWTTDTEAEAALTPCAVCSPGGTQFHRSPLPVCPPALLRCLPAKSDAVIAPCAADREPLSPPALPWFLSGWLSRRQCGCGARNTALFSRWQASEEKMKCFSRYLPYLFRPPSTILSSTCHTEGRVGRRGGCQLLTFSVWHECLAALSPLVHAVISCVQKLDCTVVGLLTLQICHGAWSCWSH